MSGLHTLLKSARADIACSKKPHSKQMILKGANMMNKLISYFGTFTPGADGAVGAFQFEYLTSLGFAALVIHHHHWLRLLFALTAVCLLGIILYRRELSRSVSAPEGRKFTGRLEKALLRQQQEDRRLNRSYSRTEALSVLGLPAATSANSPLPAQRMKMLDTLNQTANLPYLGDLLPQLQTALPLK